MKSSTTSIATVLLVMSFAHYRAVAQTPCWVPPSSLVSWWSGDSNEKDLYGVNNPSAVNAVTLVPAEVSKGFSFGSGGYIDIPHSSTLANQKFTWDAWVKPEGPGPNNDDFGSVVVGQEIDNGVEAPMQLNWRATDDRFLFIFGSITSELIISNDPFRTGSFYLVAGTYDGMTFRLYVNGVLEGSFAEKKAIPYSSSTWTIGSADAFNRSKGFPRTWIGVIDEVEAFKGALSQSAIQAIYQKGSVGKCKAAVVLTPTSLKFGPTVVGTTSPAKSITVVNNRNNAITIDGFSFTGTDPADYAESLFSTSCGSTLSGRQTCKVGVVFTPHATETRTAVLNVSDSAPGSPQTVPLSGTGITGATLTGACVHQVTLIPPLCGATPDTTQCPPGAPAINPVTENCHGGLFNVDESRRCGSGGSGKCQINNQ